MEKGRWSDSVISNAPLSPRENEIWKSMLVSAVYSLSGYPCFPGPSVLSGLSTGSYHGNVATFDVL